MTASATPSVRKVGRALSSRPQPVALDLSFRPGQMSELATLGENVAEYHDDVVESGMTYMYKVSAKGDSNEVVVSVR